MLLGFFAVWGTVDCRHLGTTHDYDGEMVTGTLDVEYSNAWDLGSAMTLPVLLQEPHTLTLHVIKKPDPVTSPGDFT